MRPVPFTHELIVIGTGPAGMAAALQARALGLRTLVLDEQRGPGGQVYRHASAAHPRVAAALGPGHARGARWARRLREADLELRHDTLVWDVSPELEVSAQHAGASFLVRAPQLIAATGALERPSPLPGWTLPGVMNAGAAQIALKTAALVPGGPAVLAGTGPLLLLLAGQLLDAGAQLAAVVETGPAANVRAAAPHLLSALGAPGYLLEGARMLWRLRRSGVPWFTRATALRVEPGPGPHGACAAALAFQAGGRARRVQAPLVLLHHGVVPDTQLSRLLRVQHRWDAAQAAWAPVTDAWGATSHAGFRVAGDGAGIGGALAAEAAGALAALGAAHALGRLDTRARDSLAAPLRRQLAHHRRVRPFLDALYAPPLQVLEPPDEVIVCRCEEVTAGRVREMARLGCQGPNQTKFFSRCGMGPCQGRVCGGVVTQLLARELGRTPEAVGAYRIRAPLKPISLGSLAALELPAAPAQRASNTRAPGAAEPAIGCSTRRP